MKVAYSEIKANGGRLVIGYEYSESVFMHAITHGQDHLDGNSWVQVTSDLKHLLQNYELFIGEDADYTKNTKVPGGPFLHPDNQDTYAFD